VNNGFLLLLRCNIYYVYKMHVFRTLLTLAVCIVLCRCEMLWNVVRLSVVKLCEVYVLLCIGALFRTLVHPLKYGVVTVNITFIHT
jgi:hypothetical protein